MDSGGENTGTSGGNQEESGGLVPKPGGENDMGTRGGGFISLAGGENHGLLNGSKGGRSGTTGGRV